MQYGYQNQDSNDLVTSHKIGETITDAYKINEHGEQYFIDSQHLVKTGENLVDLVNLASNQPPEPEET